MTSGDDVSASFLPNSFENQANLSAAGDSSFSAAPAAALVGDSQRFSKILKDSQRFSKILKDSQRFSKMLGFPVVPC